MAASARIANPSPGGSYCIWPQPTHCRRPERRKLQFADEELSLLFAQLLAVNLHGLVSDIGRSVVIVDRSG